MKGGCLQWIGGGVVAIAVFGFLMGIGSEAHLKEGDILNPMQAFFGVGFESKGVSSRVRRVYFKKWFELESEQRQGYNSDYSQRQLPQDQGWKFPWDSQNPYDVNMDGVVDEKDINVVREFQGRPPGDTGDIGSPNPRTED
jgi:hypothetical protein